MSCTKQTWNCVFWEHVGKNLAHKVQCLASTILLPCLAWEVGKIFERIRSSAASHHFLTYFNSLLNQCFHVSFSRLWRSFFLTCCLKIVMQNRPTLLHERNQKVSNTRTKNKVGDICGTTGLSKLGELSVWRRGAQICGLLLVPKRKGGPRCGCTTGCILFIFFHVELSSPWGKGDVGSYIPPSAVPTCCF